MKKSNNQYILTPIELASLCEAAIEPAAKRLNAPDYDPQHDMLPNVVQNAYRLLYHEDIFFDEKIRAIGTYLIHKHMGAWKELAKGEPDKKE